MWMRGSTDTHQIGRRHVQRHLERLNAGVRGLEFGRQRRQLGRGARHEHNVKAGGGERLRHRLANAVGRARDDRPRALARAVLGEVGGRAEMQKEEAKRDERGGEHAHETDGGDRYELHLWRCEQKETDEDAS